MSPRIARSAIVSASDGTIRIDGEPFPFHVLDDIQVTGTTHDEVTTLVLPIVVDGIVIIDDRRGRKVIDGAFLDGLGDIGAWAQAHVRTELLKAFPWLDLTKGA